MKSNLILIGMPGAGKSTVGVLLAKTLGYDFVDLDIVIAKKQGKPLQEIIDIQGMDAFLKAEEEAGVNLKTEKTVVAPGGSVVFSEAAMKNLKQDGLCIYLKVPLAALEHRLEKTRATRGLVAAADATVADIFELRRPLYERYADIVIDCTGKEVEDVIVAISKEVGLYRAIASHP